ncbi:MAG TPA: hypothetical protein VHE81_19630 [Lacipirellulaceae bacterium]|nr:hypothetical protein [Lacipirellulaceae bacterium]
MPQLYTYIIPVDDGAAPNPYGGICTLNICKPAIRRTASVDDWVAAFGSKSRGQAGRLVYAMRISDKMRMSDYDRHTLQHLSKKVPDVGSPKIENRLGDSIYDFSADPPIQRLGVHDASNHHTDLSGAFCLLSNHFVYFGRNTIEVPQELRVVIYQGRGHRRGRNDPFVSDFVRWIEPIIAAGDQIRGDPDYEIDWGRGCTSGCGVVADEDRFGEEEGEPDEQPVRAPTCNTPC